MKLHRSKQVSYRWSKQTELQCGCLRIDNSWILWEKHQFCL